MDERPSVAKRDVERAFQFDRHSELVIANAFRCLVPETGLLTPSCGDVQATQNALLAPQIQETYR